MSSLMRLCDFPASGGRTAFVKAFDFEGAEGRGELHWTADRTEAMRFDGAGAALEFWKTQSVTVPLRPDGKPNRPLTAFTIEIVPADAPADAAGAV
jgi:hypothetical protein